MLQHVLAVRGPVAQPPEQPYQLFVHIAEVELEQRRLALLTDLLVELGAHLVDHLFDARRVDPPVGDQPFQRAPGDLAP